MLQMQIESVLLWNSSLSLGVSVDVLACTTVTSVCLVEIQALRVVSVVKFPCSTR